MIVGDSVSLLEILYTALTKPRYLVTLTKVINKMNDFQFETSFTFQIKIHSLSKEDSLLQQ